MTQEHSLIFIYVDTGNSSKITGYENNYSTINLKEVYGPSFTNYVSNKFYCVKRGTDNNLPVASFRSFESFIEFAFFRIKDILPNLNSDLQAGLTSLQATAKQYILNYPVGQPPNVYETMIEQDKKLVEQEFVKAAQVYQSVQTFTIN